MFILYPEHINVFYHEAYEGNEGKNQSDLWNKPVVGVSGIIECGLKVYAEYLQVLHVFHGENA